MEGYDAPQYANIQYPWEGHEKFIGQIRRDLIGCKLCEIFYDAGTYEGEVKRLFISREQSGLALWLNGAFVGGEDSFLHLSLS